MRAEHGLSTASHESLDGEPESSAADAGVGFVPGGMLSVLTIAMGAASVLWGVIGIVVDGNPAPTVTLAMICAGICFIASGLLMWTRSLALPIIAAACGILLGIASQTMV